jgi:hypothetical protein
MGLLAREHQRRSRPVVLRFWADYIAFSWGRKLAFASVLALAGLLSYQHASFPHGENSREAC